MSSSSSRTTLRTAGDCLATASWSSTIVALFHETITIVDIDPLLSFTDEARTVESWDYCSLGVGSGATKYENFTMSTSHHTPPGSSRAVGRHWTGLSHYLSTQNLAMKCSYGHWLDCHLPFLKVEGCFLLSILAEPDLCSFSCPLFYVGGNYSLLSLL